MLQPRLLQHTKKEEEQHKRPPTGRQATCAKATYRTPHAVLMHIKPGAPEERTHVIGMDWRGVAHQR
jgi:hypothetical protein